MRQQAKRSFGTATVNPARRRQTLPAIAYWTEADLIALLIDLVLKICFLGSAWVFAWIARGFSLDRDLSRSCKPQDRLKDSCARVSASRRSAVAVATPG